MKPVIGITCGFGVIIKNPDSVHLPQEFQQLSHHYVAAVERAGGIPLLIPVLDDASAVGELLSRVDGVLLSGGNDIDPHRFGQRVSKKSGTILPKRDETELAVARLGMERTNLPILGICRGIQVLNVAMGGTLYQDLEENGMLRHQLTMFPRDAAAHEIQVAPDSRLYQHFSSDIVGVNSLHHQAVCDVAPGFRAVAWSLEDHVIEAIELPGDRFVLGVQWHPEGMTRTPAQQGIFSRFIAACGG